MRFLPAGSRAHRQSSARLWQGKAFSRGKHRLVGAVARRPAIDRLEVRQLLSAAYSVSIFGTVGGLVEPEAINDSGTVAGGYNTPDGNQHLFTYSNGKFTDLGSLGGNDGGLLSVAAINNAGQICGTADVQQSGPEITHVFLYTGGHMLDISAPLGADTISNAIAMNNSGEVVGNYLLANGNLHGFLYDNGKITDLGTLGGNDTSVSGINASGEIVGSSETGKNDSGGNPISHAFVYVNGKMTDLEGPSGANGEALAINDAGTIVGDVAEMAFKYSNGTLTNLNLPGGDSRAQAINASGQIAGFLTTSAGGLDPFLDTNGKITDLGTLGGAYGQVTAINNQGVVIGPTDSATTEGVISVYRNGTLSDLASLCDPALVAPQSLTDNERLAINNSGQITTDNANGQGLLLTPVTAGSISGTVFYDSDANGQQNNGEKGLAGWTVYDDVGDNGIFVAGDPTTMTDASGHYTLANLAPGPYTIRIEAPSTNWRELPQALALAAGQNATGRNFATLPLYSYSVTDLGTLGGQTSFATSINDSGQIVGQADTATANSSHAFLYNPVTHKMTDLGTFGGSNSDATDINNLGQIVGQADLSTTDADGNPLTSAFLYSGGKLINLGTLPNTDDSDANAINDAGTIVGTSQTIPDPTDPFQLSGDEAFIYSNGKLTLLNPPASSSFPYGDPTAINAGGQIAGYFYYPGFKGPGQNAAFLDTGGNIQFLGTLADQSGAMQGEAPFNSVAGGINDSGQVVGQSDTATGGTHASLFINGKIVDLGTLSGNADSSYAAGINNAGWIVGTSYPSSATNSLAFLYTAGQMVNLNDTLPANSGWTLTNVNAINSSNDIVGQGINPQGQDHAFLLTPVLASISGSVFNNPNGNGLGRSSTGGLGGFEVYADLKGTGVYAPGDPIATTNASGKYTLTGLPAGGYVIRIVPKAGYRNTAPSVFPETIVGAGQSATGPSFGEVATGPYLGKPAPFGLIQAENFDLGGQGVGYVDPGNNNIGGLYRPSEGVGIGAIPATDGGGYFVGWTQAGESLNYTVSVAATGTYTLNFRVASVGPGGTFHLNVDGVNVTGKLAVPKTGSWNTYTLVSKTGVHLTAGTHVLQLVLDTNGSTGSVGNFDWLQAVKT